MNVATPYYCGTEQRRQAVRTAVDGDGMPLRNGIDFLEVASTDQRTLALTFIHPLPGEADAVPAAPPLTEANVVIDGGVRVTGIVVESVAANGNMLTIVVDRAGDFSTYTLRLVATAANGEPPDGFDPRLAAVRFSFKAGCPSDFDCADEIDCPPDRLPEPDIDYLAKDYASFRRLMLDRLAITMPKWRERSAADIGIALVELMAYAGDHLSYYQDAVATEAYLGTARRRVSVRRHARMLDYTMHDGAASRAWVAITVEAGVNGLVLPGPRTVEGGSAVDAPGTRFLTRVPGQPVLLDATRRERALRSGAQSFEALHDVTLSAARNEIRFYTWDDEDCCLPRGATRAFLRNPGGSLDDLAAGDVLIFEELRGPDGGRRVDADPAHRHVVRLTDATLLHDPLYPDEAGGDAAAPRLGVVEVHWAIADALPFPLCLRELPDPASPGERVPVSVARGNVVLVEHGTTISGEELPLVPRHGEYRPTLAEAPLANRSLTSVSGESLAVNEAGPASMATAVNPRATLPVIRLRDTATNRLWLPAGDLLDSDAFDRSFVAEVEEDGRARLRFGDGVHGRAPRAGTRFSASYRVGGGSAGNVGAESIAHVETDDAGIVHVGNPLPAAGGADPEPVEQVRLYAPQAFRHQERAVTENDYAAAAQRHPDVQRARATMRWTGSWHTVFVTIDRRGGAPVDADFETELLAFLRRFPLAGYDLRIEPPRFVALDIAFTVCVERGHLRGHVKAALLDVLSRRDLAGGGRGFFHPDNFTFGESVHLSRIVAAIMAVPGVRRVDTRPDAASGRRFQRWGEPDRGEWERGRLDMARLEIARLDNDPSLPENGHLELIMEGGQ
jgi:hypothetical protein